VSPPGHHAQLRRAGIRELYQDWDDKAQASVGHLRILAAPYPHDASLLELIGRLLVQSPEFAGMWATNQIRSTTSAHYRMHHLLVGRFDVTQQLLTSAETPGQTVVMCTAPAGSPSSEAFQLPGEPCPGQAARAGTAAGRAPGALGSPAAAACQLARLRLRIGGPSPDGGRIASGDSRAASSTWPAWRTLTHIAPWGRSSPSQPGGAGPGPAGTDPRGRRARQSGRQPSRALVMPPSTSIVAPWMNAASSETAKRTT